LQATAGLHTGIKPSIDQLFQVSFEPLTEMLEHCRTTREDDVLRGFFNTSKEVLEEEPTLYKPLLTSMGDC
jgi:hypothetical protein